MSVVPKSNATNKGEAKTLKHRLNRPDRSSKQAKTGGPTKCIRGVNNEEKYGDATTVPRSSGQVGRLGFLDVFVVERGEDGLGAECLGGADGGDDFFGDCAGGGDVAQR